VIQARKRFGQHFLHDRSVLQRIADAVNPDSADAVVEIGPGTGALTALLLQNLQRLHAIEIDRDLAQDLRARFGDRLLLREGDALKFDFGAMARECGQQLRVVGNLPYNISTPLLFHLLDSVNSLRDLHVMLQREVIDRMAAQPGSSDYGRLTVMLAPHLAIEKLFDVGPGAFHPPPRVWSAVARLTVLPQPRFDIPPAFAALVAAAFSQRRKTLRNSLRRILPDSAWAATAIDPGARAETLSPAQFAELAALAQ
jgi:16S rRNA (adenine1518-N6/adenine1519-N6)-dimethyltransferase